MLHIRRTERFQHWYTRLKDELARARIHARITQAEKGHPGDYRSLGAGINEMRIHCGSGYRIYFTRRGDELIILLAGGDKASQEQEIFLARRLANDIRRAYEDRT